MKHEAEVKGYFKKELRVMYGVSQSTFQSWMRPWRKQLGKLDYRNSQKLLTPAQVAFLFDKLGKP